MSTTTILSAPPTIYKVIRDRFIDSADGLGKFFGKCTDGEHWVIWDDSDVTFTETADIAIQQALQGARVEVKGKWHIKHSKKWGNKAEYRIHDAVLKKAPPTEHDKQKPHRLGIPVEKQFNFVETDEAVYLKEAELRNEMAKVERKLAEKNMDSRKVVKLRKVQTVLDGDTSDEDSHHSPPGGPSSGSGGPSSGSGGSSSGSGGPSSGSGGPSSGGPSSSRPGGPSSSKPPSSGLSGSSSSKPGTKPGTKPGLGGNRNHGAVDGFEGSHTRFDDGMDTS